MSDSIFAQFTPGQDLDEHAPILVYIHGWGMHSGVWSQLQQLLVQDCDSLTIDLPGMGKSPLLLSEFSLEAIVPQLAAILTPYTHRRILLLGWSLGAIFAAALVEHLPSTAHLIQVAMTPQFPLNHDLNWFQTMLSEDREGTLFRFLSLMTQGGQAQRAELRILQQLVYCYGFPHPKALSGGLRILASTNQKALLTQCNQNHSLTHTVILGEDDQLVPLEYAKQEYQEINCKIHVIPKASHIPFLSNPTAFTKIIRALCREQE